VETPVLQPIYGGAAARPFTTHHNTLDAELYLRISPELYLKRLLVGGMEKVYEFSRVFRNEGLSTRHNPEFTLLELYQAYADYEVMMDITEETIATSAAMFVDQRKFEKQSIRSQYQATELIEAEFDVNKAIYQLEEALKSSPSQYDAIYAKLTQEIAELRRNAGRGADEQGVFWLRARGYDGAAKLIRDGRIGLPFFGFAIDYTRPWPRKTYDELLQEHAGVSMKDAAGARKKARELGIEEANKDDAVVVNEVFEATVEPALAKPDANGVMRPVFVKDYPAGICPLTRRKADDASVALRFELFIAGMEIANAYTELNDPTVQEANFRQQLRGEGDNAGMRVLDEDFLLAQRHGMPPAGGLGIGIDRVVMLLTNTPSIRDVVLFPLLRPEKGGPSGPSPESGS